MEKPPSIDALFESQTRKVQQRTDLPLFREKSGDVEPFCFLLRQMNHLSYIILSHPLKVKHKVGAADCELLPRLIAPAN